MTASDFMLSTPFPLSEGLVLKNRIVLSPLTRCRSTADRVPSKLNEVYYEQRAGAGLIITEATAVSDQGYGWSHAPALYTKEHAAGWKRVVNRIHAKDSKVFLQMWHMGRQAHSSFNAKKEIVSSSAIRVVNGHIRDANHVVQEFEMPRALETEEVAGIVEDFRRCAELAKEVGFDGVEIHGANGFLVDQFLQSGSNTRTDKYGGSIENRARFLLEVVDAVKSVWPADRIGVRVSPNASFGDMGSGDNVELFTYVFERLSHHGLAYLAIRDGFGYGFHAKCRRLTACDAKTHFKGAVIANNSYTRETAEGALVSGAADLIAFGRAYLSNPDLAERFKNDWPLNPLASTDVYYDFSLGAKGYIDFPFYGQPQASNGQVP